MQKKLIGDLSVDELELILGYAPSREQILEMITYAKEKGLPIGQVARDRSLPPLYYDFENSGFIETLEGRMKIEDYHKLHPWLRLIIISSDKQTVIETNK